MLYIKIRAWHVVRHWTRVPNRAVTLCGRTADGDSAPGFGGDKSCETCLRILSKMAGEG